MRDYREKLKIVFFTHYSSMNGANQSLFTLINFIKNDVDIVMVYINGIENKENGLEQELNKINIKSKVLRLPPFLYYSGLKSFFAIPFKLVRNIPSWHRIYKELKTNRVNWIYSNSSVENSGLFIAKLLNIKHLWHIREFGYKDYKYFHVGGDFFKRTLFGHSDKLVAISKSIADYIGIQNKTHLVYNGIFSEYELKKISVVKKKGVTINIGMVGIISETKNQLRAVHLIRNLTTEFNNKINLDFYGSIGNDIYYRALQKTIRSHSLEEYISFRGFVADKAEIYQNMDILLMCSPSEAFGRVTIEAMAYGIPVIGYNNAGTAELIQNNLDGFLYDDKESTLENVLIDLIRDEILYQKISKNGKLKAEHYSVEKYASSILNLLQTV